MFVADGVWEPETIHPAPKAIQFLEGFPNQMVKWTCKCGHENLQRWYENEEHVCSECDEWTLLERKA